MPLINNIINEKFDGQIVHNMISSQEKRNWFVKELATLVKAGGYHGINIDFENLDSRDKSAYTEFIKELCNSFHSSGYYVSVDLPSDSSATYDYKVISDYCDFFIIMLYDEHYSAGTPGPIASQKWFESQLNSVIPYIPKEKMAAGL
ncbi:MAG: glycosyl hydrolase family 18 protein [Clostridiaceae bacterium]